MQFQNSTREYAEFDAQKNAPVFIRLYLCMYDYL